MSRKPLTYAYALATLLAFAPLAAFAASGDAMAQVSLAERLKGYILLQVQARGEAWYVRPTDGKRYYMKDGAAAYQMMRTFSLGITDADLSKIATVGTTAEMKSSTSVCASNAFANGLRGKILLQVQKRGEAWYVDPVKCRVIYMQDGAAAYAIMRYLSLGITDANLAQIPVGTLPGGETPAQNETATDTPAAVNAPADTTVPDTGTTTDTTQATSTQSTTDSPTDASTSYVSPQNWNVGGGDALTDF